MTVCGWQKTVMSNGVLWDNTKAERPLETVVVADYRGEEYVCVVALREV